MKLLPISEVKLNKDNPRIIKDKKYKKLLNSVRDSFEFMNIRPIIIDEDNVANPSLMKLWKTFEKQGLISPLGLMEAIEEKHETSKEYLYKGKLAGQIIQWVEANLIHNIAVEFMKQDIPCLTVYDELIVEEEHLPMVKEFMYSSGHCDICNEHSLLSQIKSL